MDIVYLDFETYYSATYSLSKMTTQEYIMSDEFEAMLLSYKINNEPTRVLVSPTQADLLALGLDKCVVVAHNAGFDVGILSMRYGIKPAFIFDTLGAARSLGFSAISGCSLDALAKTMRKLYPQIPTKGTAVKRMLGLHMSDLTPAELAEYSEYCKTDTDICAILSKHLMELIPEDEARFQDMILRCATEPVIEIDRPLVEAELTRIMERRDNLQQRLSHVLGSTMEEALLTIMSNAKFADALVKVAEENGCPSDNIVPWKISGKTGKQTHAFAKTDQAMQDLLEHPVEDIAMLAATRMGLKTTTEHTRLERFLKLSKFNALSIPYNISGAHTHRLSGASGINLQNLPAGDGRVQGQSDAARRSLVAPEGKILISGDSKQIETRILAYIVGDMQALEDFANGLDPYVTMAASIYGIPYEVLSSELISDDPAIRSAAKVKRQIGKSARLGCGFQLGPAGFVNYCKVISKIDISEEEANDIVARFRATNPLMVQFWATCKDVLMKMEMGHKGYFGGPNNDLFYYNGMDSVGGARVPSIRMPDGMKLYYNNLEWVKSTKFEGMTMVYTHFKRAAAIKHGIYGGKLTENLVQALAFALMKYQGVLLQDNGFRIAANTHDEYTTVVPQEQVTKRVSMMKKIMDTAPEWLPGCPLGSDIGYAKSYADC